MRKLEYVFKEHKNPKNKKQKISFLQEAQTAEYPQEQQKRDKKSLLLKNRSFPNQRILSIEYDKKKRVTQLNGPDGLLANLNYQNSFTEVIDGDGNKTTYEYDPKTLRLTKISYYQGQNILLKTEIFTWNFSGCLATKSILSPENTPLLKITHQYDVKLNLTSKTLTGDQEYTFKYKYDNQNRLIEESEENGKQTSYTYLDNTSLPEKKNCF